MKFLRVVSLCIWSVVASTVAVPAVTTSGVVEIEGNTLSSRKVESPVTGTDSLGAVGDNEEEYVVGPIESKIAKFFGFDLEGDIDEDRSVQLLGASSPSTCGSYTKCTKCVKVEVCNWCEATSKCYSNSDPAPQCLTKKQWISSKWKCPGHLRWWGVLLICLACVCCCPIISALCFFFVIKRFCCGD